MVLKERYQDLLRCSRCSYCKFIPLGLIWDKDYSYGCPSISYKNFHTYSAGGRVITALALLENRLVLSDKLMDVAFECLTCGSCHTTCQINKVHLEPREAIIDLREFLVEKGLVSDEHRAIIEGLRKDDNMMQKPKKDRGRWANGLKVKNLTKENAEVLFHAGCRYSYDEELWPIVRGCVELLQKLGVDIGIMGMEETCCGVRALELGFRGEFSKYAEHNVELWRTKNIKTVVTPCAECYHAFIYRYSEKWNKKLGVEVFHATQFFNKLIKEGRLKLERSVPIKVAYHDPCHLGRLGEPYEPWTGRRKKIRNQIPIWDPPKPRRMGIYGVYEEPREILRSIPGLELVEMKRIKEYAWCCGGGGGAKEYDPKFALWTAEKRIEEALASGAEAIVTACPWCKRNFLDALQKNQQNIKVYDIIELVLKSAL
ncbi:MAG: (Fe-S)-binding protein [Candidatus Bathyarchaeia archaeon]